MGCPLMTVAAWRLKPQTAANTSNQYHPTTTKDQIPLIRILVDSLNNMSYYKL